MPPQFRQLLLWIALLVGVTDAADPRARLSVFVSPRLRAREEENLGSFPDFVDPAGDVPNWAARMHPTRVSFAVEVDGEASVAADIVSPPPDPALWAAAFGPTTPVQAHQFDDYADRPLVTFPVRRILEYVRDRYVNIAARSPFDLPTHDELAVGISEGDEGFQQLLTAFAQPLTIHGSETGSSLSPPSETDLTRGLAAVVDRLRGQAQDRRARHLGATIGPGDGDPLVAGADGEGAPGAFGQAMVFHYRPAAAEPVELPENETAAREAFQESVDFHQMLSALGDYPALLRRLGLVIDLELPAASIPKTNGGPPRRLRVIPTWTSSEPATEAADFSPWTVYTYSDGPPPLFAPATRSGEITRGLWTPPAADIDVVQVDTDGTALKTLNTVFSLARLVDRLDHLPIDAPDRAGVVTLRTGGLSLARSGNAAAMNDGFNIAHNLNVALESGAPPVVELFAEDLTRGYRVDVWDDVKSTWRSLHQRVGSYSFLDFAEGELHVEDEGVTQLSVTEPAKSPTAPPDPNAELYVHESLLTWDGWSLSVPRPGLSISRSPRAPVEGDEETQPQSVPNTAMTSLRLETSFQAQQASLPRLRFGQRYSLRVRTVDLAGNSLTLDEADQRLDDLPAGTAVFPDDRLVYGRFEPVSAPVLVPRAAYGEGESLERLVIRSNHDASTEEYALAHPIYQAANDRHVAAPKASLQLVETHGMLDAAFDAKHSGLSEQEIEEEVQKVYQLALREEGSLDDPLPTTERIVRNGSYPDDPEGYTIHTEDQLQLPYLPDPLAPGVVLQGLPGNSPDTLTRVTFGGAAWHDAVPFRFRLVEGHGPPVWDEQTRVLTVALPKATMVTVRLSSMFDGDLTQLGLWRWIEAAFEAGQISNDRFDELVEAVQSGRHWMFTPFRDVTLVHAVQQPLDVPVPQVQVHRAWGTTYANLKGDVSLHIPSTAKLDLRADWSEPRDDPSAGDPAVISVNAHVTEVPVAVGPDWDDLLGHMLTVRDDGNLSFNTDTWFNADIDVVQTVRNRLAAATLQGERVTLQAQLDVLQKLTPHEFGDTKRRRVSYQFVATSRFREYFSPQITHDPQDSDSMSRLSEAFELDIPSSARPAPPKVLYVLPTFAWETASDATGTTRSVRRGNGLRVYLDRPWFSSGEGELLGVVLGFDVTTPTSADYAYVTYWGQDPIWQSPSLPSPRPIDFPLGVATAEGLTIPELSGERLRVVGHAVELDQFDPDRKLWFCDIEMRTEAAYMPFVRLALARYQPNSVPGAHLSQVVLADIVQTVPDRSLTVVRDPFAPGLLTVSLTGVSYRSRRDPSPGPGPEIAGPSQVVVSFEARDPGVADDVLAWSPLESPASESELGPGPFDEHGVVTWTGPIVVPPAGPGQRLRLVVKEYEQGFTGELMANLSYRPTRRLVYLDTIEL